LRIAVNSPADAPVLGFTPSEGMKNEAQNVYFLEVAL